MKSIELPVAHYAIVHLLAGAMCGFLLQWGVVGYPRDADTNAEVRAAVAKVNAVLQSQQKAATVTHRTAPNPIPPAVADETDLIPATSLPER